MRTFMKPGNANANSKRPISTCLACTKSKCKEIEEWKSRQWVKPYAKKRSVLDKYEMCYFRAKREACVNAKDYAKELYLYWSYFCCKRNKEFEFDCWIRMTTTYWLLVFAGIISCSLWGSRPFLNMYTSLCSIIKYATNTHEKIYIYIGLAITSATAPSPKLADILKAFPVKVPIFVLRIILGKENVTAIDIQFNVIWISSLAFIRCDFIITSHLFPLGI